MYVHLYIHNCHKYVMCMYAVKIFTQFLPQFTSLFLCYVFPKIEKCVPVYISSHVSIILYCVHSCGALCTTGRIQSSSTLSPIQTTSSVYEIPKNSTPASTNQTLRRSLSRILTHLDSLARICLPSYFSYIVSIQKQQTPANTNLTHRRSLFLQRARARTHRVSLTLDGRLTKSTPASTNQTLRRSLSHTHSLRLSRAHFFYLVFLVYIFQKSGSSRIVSTKHRICNFFSLKNPTRIFPYEQSDSDFSSHALLFPYICVYFLCMCIFQSPVQSERYTVSHLECICLSDTLGGRLSRWETVSITRTLGRLSIPVFPANPGDQTSNISISRSISFPDRFFE